MTKEEYEKMHEKKEKHDSLDRASEVTKRHIIMMKDCVGSYKELAKIINFQECQLRSWRRGVKMKATTAMLVEKRFNDFIDSLGDIAPEFRCDRKKLIYYFFW